MSFKLKKNLLMIISIINTIISCIYLGRDIINDFNIKVILLDSCFLLLALIPFICIKTLKRFKHLYYLIPFYSLLAFIGVSIPIYLFSIIGIIISFVETKVEEGKLVKLIKGHPIVMSLTIILSGMSFLSFGSVFEFFSELIYGFSMLGELIATIFLIVMIFICKKGYLLYRNKGSILEAVMVSLPFIIYSFYIGCSVFCLNFLEGYKLLSLDNIIVIIVLYLLVGVFEDFLTRGLALNILLDKFGKTKKGIWLSVFLSSLFFGLAHLINLFTGASLQGVLIQVLTAVCIGMYFSAIYLRSGSVWVPALLHGFYDVAASTSLFFVIKEVVDVSGDYGETISNYGWGNLVVGGIFILLTIFLLRKKKMDSVWSTIKGCQVVKKDSNVSSYVLLGFSLSFGFGFCFLSCNSFFEFRDYAVNLYEKISPNYIGVYGSIYKNGYYDYDSISDEVKLLVAFSNIDKLNEAEDEFINGEVVTYIEKDEIKSELKKIFNKDEVEFVDFDYSYQTTCAYKVELSRYECLTSNNIDFNGLYVYSDIAKISFSGDNLVEVSVYYLVEDIYNNTIYSDSDLNTIYLNNTSISDISGGIEYISGGDNKEFWANIKENNNGEVPTYTISMELSDLGDSLYFVSSEFDDASIDD